jgi:membrane-bound lytic murein transglycosylase B
MQFLKRFFTLFSIVALISGSVPTISFAQTSSCTTDVVGRSKAELQADLDACNQEISQWTTVLNNTKEQSASYKRDIAVLTAKINAAQASIKAKNIAIANLSRGIAEKQTTIDALNAKIETGKQSLSEILRKTSALDSASLAQAVLSDKDLSEFFVDVNTYTSTERSMEDLFNNLRGNRGAAEDAKAELARQKQDAADAAAAIAAQKKQVESDKVQKNLLLADSQSKEKSYAEVLRDKQAKAAQIRAVLFPLAGVDTQIQFGTALAFATAAGARTGVRPALILGILQQESNLGANVGSCIITNLTTGETKSVTSGRIFPNGIHPTRDLPLLQTIVTGLGRDPLTTKVSCPIGSGYGGAMGPTQFIPSTWVIIASKVESYLGKSLADPWNPQDAIYATAIMLSGDGAATQDPTNERTAACRYYSGRNCYSSNGAPAAGLSYGNSVMAKAAAIQQNIDALQGL